ncbi:hypothetical protein SNOG_08925 [Parastagonospora nodorum SN15]|uniref:Uncharacterized protein n=1 Tax=Phaeosphaeria nodorum (strain SN15 / ATCC MYA-4574 / FGSC 10173) TaxID=321614 RepID=Q0UH39_PHANO|nr:hypothetical protein SNOG_08925 [Parastagonospora nodorum SN15]EAT84093.1 hypothetical protein SNOG_08925 [Parastagonospora nodorum SN15]
MTDYDLELTKTTIAMYISRALSVLATVFAFTTTIAALPTPGPMRSSKRRRGNC